jgi:hypothetical protein
LVSEDGRLQSYQDGAGGETVCPDASHAGGYDDCGAEGRGEMGTYDEDDGSGGEEVGYGGSWTASVGRTSRALSYSGKEDRTRAYYIGKQMEETGKVVAQLRLEMMAKDLEGDGAGSSREGADQGDPNRRRREPQQERVREEEDQVMGGRGHPSLPKYSFPRFQGKEPGIWLAKCQDYFTIYQVPEALWAISTSMHMEGNATRWLQVYKMRQGLGNWMQFGRAVRAKFGVEEYPKAMRHLLNLYQKNGVEEYAQEFEEARYATAVHNPGMDEIFLSISL